MNSFCSNLTIGEIRIMRKHFYMIYMKKLAHANEGEKEIQYTGKDNDHDRGELFGA